MSLWQVESIVNKAGDGSPNFPNGLTGVLYAPDGSVASPGIPFQNELSSGIYRIDTGKMGIAIQGSKVAEIGAGYGGFVNNIIQVAYLSSLTLVTTTTNATLLTINFTPKSNNSRILFFGFSSTTADGVAGNNQTVLRIRENTTVIASSQALTVQTSGAYPQRIPMVVNFDIANTVLTSRSFNLNLQSGSADTIRTEAYSFYIFEVLL